MKFLDRVFGSPSDHLLGSFKPLVSAINQAEAGLLELSDDKLKSQTNVFKERLKAGETLDDILPEAFALVREVARRTLGQPHYDVQLLGGIALHKGKIAEMRTGEGKTLVATLPIYLNALTGRGVHLVTVNDYLARRDAVWMGQIYAFLGLSIGVLNHETSYLYDASHTEADPTRDREGSFKVVHEFLRPVSRHEAYLADITYGTNNEYGFDYLRDNLTYDPKQVVQRSDQITGRYHFAIVDEVDSILIDEARTPLIISAPSGDAENLYGTFTRIAATLVSETDYTVDEKLKAITLNEEGIQKAEKALGIENIYTEGGIKYVHHLETAVRAAALYQRDRHYVVKDGEVIIVDEFTGRLQPGRRWSEGLHQAIESKEGVRIREESRTFATVTLQNYFRMYEKLSGMTGTAATSAEEFFKVYQLEVVSVPSNKPSQRLDKNDQVFQTEKGKWQALTKKIKTLYDKGQPVLVGTVSIEKNELLSTYFTQAGIPHEILNAKNHEQEGSIIAQAGRRGSVVIATNMAGRGVDIKLGGANPTPEEADEIRTLGGLYVIGTERHEARRIDNQLRGRSGRQGDPGETEFFLSLEDTLMRVFATSTVKNLMGKLGIAEDQPIEHRLVTKAIEGAQEKIEGLNFDIRKHLIEYDDVTNHQRQTIYARRREVLFGGPEAIDKYLDRVKEVLADPDFDKVLAEKKQTLGESFYHSARQMILQVMDMYWVEHLEGIEYMRGSVRLRAYGQRDPLVEFKREGLNLFKDLEFNTFSAIAKILPEMGQMATAKPTATIEVKETLSALEETADSGQTIVNNSNPTISEPKIGRNDLCPCGSGKKWKKCGFLNTEEHQTRTKK